MQKQTTITILAVLIMFAAAPVIITQAILGNATYTQVPPVTSAIDPGLGALIVAVAAGFLVSYLAVEGSPQSEKWDWRKFFAAVITTTIATLTITLTLQPVIDVKTGLLVFAAAIGTDYIRNKIGGMTGDKPKNP